MLRKIFIDEFLLNQLHTLVNHDRGIMDVIPTEWSQLEHQNLLRLLVLYEEVDAVPFNHYHYKTFDWGSLVNNGIISLDSALLNTKTHDSAIDIRLNDPDLRVKGLADLAYSIIGSSIDVIGGNFLRTSNGRKWLGENKFESIYTRTEVVLDLLRKYEGEVCFNIEIDSDLHKKLHISPVDVELGCYLETMIINLHFNLYQSTKNRNIFTSVLAVDQNFRRDRRIVSPEDNLYYLAKTNFKDETRFLPNPETLDDVFRLRESKHIQRYREVFGNWIQVATEGNVRLEEKLRKDLAKANKEIKKLNKWREYKESEINFVINAVGGHVPLLSNFLTIINTVAHIYEQRMEQRHCWIQMFA